MNSTEKKYAISRINDLTHEATQKIRNTPVILTKSQIAEAEALKAKARVLQSKAEELSKQARTLSNQADTIYGRVWDNENKTIIYIKAQATQAEDTIMLGDCDTAMLVIEQFTKMLAKIK